MLWASPLPMLTICFIRFRRNTMHTLHRRSLHLRTWRNSLLNKKRQGRYPISSLFFTLWFALCISILIGCSAQHSLAQDNNAIAVSPPSLSETQHTKKIRPNTHSGSTQVTALTIDERITVQAILAITPEQRTKGLMHTTHLPANTGMLFVFPQEKTLCFWMKNTPMPLDVAFIDSTRRIVHIAVMHPYSLHTHCSPTPAAYALEMPQGWFAQHGITPAHSVSNLPPLSIAE